MRKRFVTTIFAAFMCAACALGVTACGGGTDTNTPNGEDNTTTQTPPQGGGTITPPDGGNDENVTVPKGEQVADEAAWKSAFAANVDADNITVKGYCIETLYIKKNETIESTTMNTNMSSYLSNGRLYGKVETTVTSGNDGETQPYYNTEGFYVVENSLMWSSNKSYVSFGQLIENPEWIASKNSYTNEETAKKNFKVRRCGSFTTREDLLYGTFSHYGQPLEEKKLVDLYSSFTYANGVYTAKNLSCKMLFETNVTDIEITIKNGCVIGFSVSCLFEGSETTSREIKGTYTYTNIGTTTFTPPQDALDAIAAEKNKQ